jgi:hypothetical protein
MSTVLSIDVANKNITFQNETLFNITEQDFSWIPSDVTYVIWYGTEGRIKYKINEEGSVPVEFITELGIYEQAIEMFNNEKQRIADEKKAQEELIEAEKDYWKLLRDLRNSKLSRCDWTQIADVSLTEEQKIAWGTYRQELRNLPANTEDPKNPVWPVEPSF